MIGGGKRMKKWLKLMVLMVLVLFAAACASDKKPAEEAIKAAETAINAAKGDAAKYIPDQVKAWKMGSKPRMFARKTTRPPSVRQRTCRQAKDLAAAAEEDRIDQSLGGNERWSSQDGRGHKAGSISSRKVRSFPRI
jgi:hypothetical protein